MIPIAWAAALAALKSIGLGGAVAAVRTRLTGPMAGAIAIGVLALGLVIGIGWLVHDAKGTAREACAADKLRDELAEARIRETQLRQALRQRESEAARLSDQARAADDEIKRLETEMEDLRDRSKSETTARPALPGDDPWLRNSAGHPARARDR